MIKLFLKLCSLYIFLMPFYANASLLVDCDSVANDTCSYITYEYQSVEYDIAWASSVNSERWYFKANGVLGFNELYNPTIHSGWNYAGKSGLPELLDIFSSEDEILSLFKLNGLYIHAFDYWNSAFVTVDTSLNNLNNISGEEDLINKNIKSALSWSGAAKSFDAMTLEEKGAEINAIMSASGSSYDTFYVRERPNLEQEPKPVPEPSTLMIFALGLIALASKKRLFK